MKPSFLLRSQLEYVSQISILKNKNKTYVENLILD